MPDLTAARSFSLSPPMGSTLPLRVISPVMATFPFTGMPVSALAMAVAIVMPALGPSLGTAPSGTCRCISFSLNSFSSIPSISALAWTKVRAAFALSCITSPSLPVSSICPLPFTVSKSTPQLSNINAATFPEYVASGAIVDLAEYFNDPTIGFTAEEQADFFESYMAEVKSFGPEGTLYGFPTNKKTTDIFVYNKTYFDAKGWSAPTTWDQVAEYSKIIYEETGMPGFSYDTAYGEAAFKTLSTQWGSPYVTADGVVDINNEASLAAINFFKENMDAGYFTLPALMPSAGGNNSSNGFVMQECYMFVGAAAGIAYALPNAEKGHEVFEVGVAAIPQKDASAAATFSKGENYVMFANSTDEQRVATWLLIKFLSEAENNSEWLINTGNLPISQSQVEDADYQAFLTMANDGSAAYYKAAHSTDA